ncbi:MAG: hypothetical protein Q4F78_08840 [Bacillota bacterium]|nr:hypothetical protein [Bacillota bacterium]
MKYCKLIISRFKNLPASIRTLIKILLYPIIIWIVFIIAFCAIKGMAQTGHISLQLDNVSKINTIRASGINGVFVDDFEGNSASISIKGRTTIYSNVFELYAINNNGELQEVEEIIIQPHDYLYHNIELAHPNGRIDYEIVAGSEEREFEVFAFDSVLSYHTTSDTDYSYRINTPCLRTDIFYRPNMLPVKDDIMSIYTNGEYAETSGKVIPESFYIEVPDCEVFGVIRKEKESGIVEEKGEPESSSTTYDWAISDEILLRDESEEVQEIEETMDGYYNTDYTEEEDILVDVYPIILIKTSTEMDKNLSEMWTGTQLIFESESGVQFNFTPWLDKLESIDISYFNIFYPIEFDAIVSGKMFYRYGTEETEYILKNESLHFNIPEEEEIQTMRDVNSTISINTFENGTAIIDYYGEHPISMQFDIHSIDGKRVTRMDDYNSNVYQAWINGISLFPDLKTFIVDNWKMEAVITIVLFLIGYIIEAMKSLGKGNKD